MVKTNSLQAWILAARPKTLTGAAIPVLLSASLAYSDGLFDWKLSLICLLFAWFMQIAANFINDLYDFEKGSDREDRLGPERACAQGWITAHAMRIGISVVIVIACAIGLLAVLLTWKVMPYNGLEYVLVGLFCVIFAFLYTSVMSYLGLGDLLVLIFFGVVPVCGTYYLQALTISSDCIILSLISGIAIDALLMINNYRDRDQDKLSGKKTIVVRFGEKFGRYAYLAIAFIVDCLIFMLFIDDKISLLGLVLCVAVYSALHIRTWLQMVSIFQGKELNIILGQTSRNMFVLAVLLCIAMLAV